MDLLMNALRPTETKECNFGASREVSNLPKIFMILRIRLTGLKSRAEAASSFFGVIMRKKEQEKNARHKSVIDLHQTLVHNPRPLSSHSSSYLPLHLACIGEEGGLGEGGDTRKDKICLARPFAISEAAPLIVLASGSK